MSMHRLKREIETEIESLEKRKKLKKKEGGEDKKSRKAPPGRPPSKLKFKLCNVDFKTEKDFTQEGLEMIGKDMLRYFTRRMTQVFVTRVLKLCLFQRKNVNVSVFGSHFLPSF